eukprot:TRINITY_DN32569_c0_g1_i1.p1 TRINITY_DN32569_c0_g1~~TRINITY_DN32569_c0_g1_i1.p1  ORF type:complete len:186 (-),score=28.93 TRINITY_DN32569_c0_g1_i1:771-1328(-)
MAHCIVTAVDWPRPTIQEVVGLALEHLLGDKSKDLWWYSMTQLEEDLKTAKAGKAVGPDGINLFCLKHAPHATKVDVVSAINTAMATGRMPDKWASVDITMIYKNGDPLNPKSYRPISISTCVAILLGKHLQQHLQVVEELNGMLTSAQKGFKKFGCTITGVLDVMQQARLHPTKNFILVKLDLA